MAPPPQKWADFKARTCPTIESPDLLWEFAVALLGAVYNFLVTYLWMTHYVSDQPPSWPDSADWAYVKWSIVRFIYSFSYLLLTGVIGALIRKSRGKRRFLGVMMGRTEFERFLAFWSLVHVAWIFVLIAQINTDGLVPTKANSFPWLTTVGALPLCLAAWIAKSEPESPEDYQLAAYSPVVQNPSDSSP
ncbi:hypothetical protein B0T24DRAFT_610366 [Lasiosphaeria ovina]|uniref:Uncharacterized protein n=1 Tax=Lasiosphaeria ovina TaxID=92902 RepID=A0AAE0NCJ1_9PEZI|nr:hypothetical protein B0T24DRAFT_610366 [Lasiosphaeria ovina]